MLKRVYQESTNADFFSLYKLFALLHARPSPPALSLPYVGRGVMFPNTSLAVLLPPFLIPPNRRHLRSGLRPTHADCKPHPGIINGYGGTASTIMPDRHDVMHFI
jgi:hypothetical protein